MKKLIQILLLSSYISNIIATEPAIELTIDKNVTQQPMPSESLSEAKTNQNTLPIPVTNKKNIHQNLIKEEVPILLTCLSFGLLTGYATRNNKIWIKPFLKNKYASKSTHYSSKNFIDNPCAHALIFCGGVGIFISGVIMLYNLRKQKQLSRTQKLYYPF